MPIDGQRLTGLISLLEKKTISHTIAAKVLELMFDEEGTAEEIVNRHNMAQISDTSAIEEACKEAVSYTHLDVYKRQVQALLSKRGDCNQYVYLFVASLRSLGIPARWYSGYLYLPQEHSAAPYLTANGNLNGDEMRHIWAEVYIPNCGWIVVDPTYSYTAMIEGTSQKLVDWDKFAQDVYKRQGFNNAK